MFDNFLLNQILFFVLWSIALVITRAFIRSKDGMLRKIMICYFGWESITYMVSAFYFSGLHYHWFALSPDTFRLMILIPKAGIKIWLLYYLILTAKKIES